MTAAGAAAALMGDPHRSFGFSCDPVVPSRQTSRVVRVFSEKLVEGRTVESRLLRKSLEGGLCALTSTVRVDDAWSKLLSPDDSILLKFNQSGARQIGTTPVMAEALTASLISAGWNPERICLLEHGSEGELHRGLRRADTRWQGQEVNFGKSGRDVFMAALDQATAIINVPFLKTHRLATMTGCLKNLSHGLIRHPARFHANGCDPAIGEIVASNPVRSKLRLNIVNALRLIYDRPETAREMDIHTEKSVLMSTDPVACDLIGFGILNSTRSLYQLGPLLSQARLPSTIPTAHRLGIGESDPERIEMVNLEL